MPQSHADPGRGALCRGGAQRPRGPLGEVAPGAWGGSASAAHGGCSVSGAAPQTAAPPSPGARHSGASTSSHHRCTSRLSAHASRLASLPEPESSDQCSSRTQKHTCAHTPPTPAPRWEPGEGPGLSRVHRQPSLLPGPQTLALCPLSSALHLLAPVALLRPRPAASQLRREPFSQRRLQNDCGSGQGLAGSRVWVSTEKRPVSRRHKRTGLDRVLSSVFVTPRQKGPRREKQLRSASSLRGLLDL